MQDSVRHPKLFVWNGGIVGDRLNIWLQKHNLNLPEDLITLWEVTGGGDLFESETILSPFGDANLGDDIDSVNEFHYSQGMKRDYLVFHVGTGLSAVRLADSCYVYLNDSYQDLSEFLTLEEWYIAEIRSEYARRYHLDLSALKSIKEHLNRDWKLAERKKYTDLLSLREKKRLKNLRDRINQKIIEVTKDIPLATLTDDRRNFTYEQIKIARQNFDFPEWQEVNDFSENLLAYGQCLEENSVSVIEENARPDWLLPTSTLSKPDFDLWHQFDSGKLQLENIDRFWLETLVSRERLQETLLNWENEPLIEERYPILKQSIEAHLSQQFYLSVSTLIPQIEGLIRDILKSQGKVYEFNSLDRHQIKPVIRDLTNTWKSDAPDMLKGLVSILESLPYVIEDLYHKYLPQTQPNEIIPGKLYRNAVCHGLQLDFGSEKNSLRLILLIDRIVFFYTRFGTNP